MAAILLLGMAAIHLSAQERRHVLLEQFSSEGCANCVPGTGRLESYVANMVNQVQVSWISHHSGYYSDFLTVPESLELTHLFLVYPEDKERIVPAFMIDRLAHNGQICYQIEDHLIEPVLNDAMSRKETVAIEGIDLKFDPASRLFKAKLVAKALDGYTGGEEFYLNLAITEDHIKAEQQAGIPEGVDYYHNHALRSFLAGAKGLKADPSNAVGEWEISIPETWNLDNLKVIAFVHRALGSEEALPSDPSVYVSRQYDFPASGTAISSVDEEQMKVYWGGSKLVVEGEYSDLKVYDLQGRLHPVDRLEPSVYVVVVERPNGVYNKKILVK